MKGRQEKKEESERRIIDKSRWDGERSSIDCDVFQVPIERGGSVEEYMREMREDREDPWEQFRNNH